MKMSFSVAGFILFCVMSVDASQLDGCTNTNIKKLFCQNYTASFLPYDRKYKAVEEINIQGNFSEMNINPQYSMLRVIRFRSNSLTEFSFERYKNFWKLITVDLNENQIERVNFSGIQNMVRIKLVQLSFNRITQLDSCQSLKNLSSLITIYLMGNSLVDFDLGCLPKKFARLYLNDNQLANISSCQNLKDLTSLITLALPENRLEVIDFSCLPFSLSNLFLYSNNISEIKNCRALKTFPNLGRISLAENKLESFDFSCLPASTYEIFLHCNMISRVVSGQSLRSLSLLSGLFLASNKLSRFNLTNLPEGIINLSLANNSLSLISSCDSLKSLSHLQNLFLDGNNFASFNFSCLPSSIKQVDLSRNEISRLVSFASLNQLPLLTRLSLASNRIANLELNYLPQSIKYLLLQNNTLTKIDLDILAKYPLIKTAIDSNPMNCSCEFLIMYVKAVRSGKLLCQDENACVTCSRNSRLASYPWSKDTDSLRSHDDNSLGCFTAYLKEATSTSLSSNTTTEGCTLERIHDLLPRVVCKNYNLDKFPYEEDLVEIESLNIRGDFVTFQVDARYTQLRHIKLFSRFLNVFDMVAFSCFKLLKVLDLSDNGVEDLIVANLSSIDEINLQNNSLSTLLFGDDNKSLATLTTLKKLFLGNNNLQELDTELLPLELAELNLRGNQISTIMHEGMERMTRLKVLDLSLNNLDYFPFQFAPDTLENLWLNGNRISGISIDDCNRFSGGLKLDVYDNPLNCTCASLFSYISAVNTCNIAFVSRSSSTLFTCRHSSETTQIGSIGKLKDIHASTCVERSNGKKTTAIMSTVAFLIIAICLSVIL